LRDDAAVLAVPGGGSLIISVDSVVEGVHVDLALCTPADVGWKALMGALSDLAAMGARPVGAVVGLCVPAATGGGDLALGVAEGLAEAAGATGCPVLGGDLSRAPALMVAVTVFGTVDGGQAVGRGGAHPGDALIVTGPCGGSAAGLRVLRDPGHAPGSDGATAASADAVAAAYRRPVARLAEGWAARLAGAHAMMDVSDGLALDLHRLADESSVGFALDAVPVAPGATQDEALGGGEDYELVVALDPADVDALTARCAAAGLRPPLRLGSVLADAGVRTLAGKPLAPMGWQHRLD
jgi:thiamine-monophosphate kinase